MTHYLVLFLSFHILFLDTLAVSNQISQILNKDFQILMKTSEQSCALRLIISQNESILDLSVIEAPYLLQFAVTDTEIKGKSSIVYKRSKHQISCWINLVEITSGIDIQRNLPQESSQDHYIFISTDIKHMEYFYTENSVLDLFARKYAMVFYSDISVPPIYLSDPSVYTGSLQKSGNICFKRKLNNFNGRSIPIAYLHIPPYFHRLTDPVKGFQNHFLEEMAKRANFTPKFYDNIKYPGTGMLVNGTWTGCIGELVSGHAELSPILAISVERFSAITQTEQMTFHGIVFVVRAGEVQDKWHTYRYVAIALNITFLVLFLCRSVLLKWAKLKTRNYARTMFVIWTGVFAFVGVTCRCRLTAFLTIAENVKTPSTLKELYDQKYSTIMWRIGDGGMEMEMIRTSQNPIVKALRKHMTFESDILKCLEKAGEPQTKTACFGWRPSLQMMIAKNSAFNVNLKELRISKDAVDTVTGVVGLRKGSIFVETVNRYILAARSGNLDVRWEKDIYIQLKKEAYRKLRATGSDSIRLSDDIRKKSKNKLGLIINMVYLVLSFGCCISLTALFVEYVMGCTRNVLNARRIMAPF